MSQLNEIGKGKVVLFVNAIRSDLLSGGNSSTTQILEQFKKNSCLYEFNLSKNKKGLLKVINIIVGLPGSIFVILNRHTKFVAFEFLTRLSLFTYIQFGIKCYTLKPDVIVFNHHASFLYSLGFNKVDKVFIWHDIPSIKDYENTTRLSRAASKISIIFEKIIVRKSLKHFAFSFADQKFFKRFHGCDLGLLPIMLQKSDKNTQVQNVNAWLMLGNWSRNENREGASQFFNIYATLAREHHYNIIQFVIAGNAADKFLEILLKNSKNCKLNITAIPYYENLSNLKVNGLLAPITQGAGIKVKVLESWASGLPVIGTSKAFSGLPKNIQKIGGIRVSNIIEMVNLIISDKAINTKSLRPHSAYLEYLDAIKISQN